MTQLTHQLTCIPPDTAQAVRSLFGRGNLYIRLGEMWDELFAGLDAVDLLSGGWPRYALVSAVQYAEGMTDRQVIEAIRRRVDLRYALRLPLNAAPFQPGEMCAFRRHVYGHPASRQALQILFDRLDPVYHLEVPGVASPLALDVLETNCALSRLDLVVDAMYRALEALVVADAEWLRRSILPHWYLKYSYSQGIRNSSAPRTHAEWNARMLQISVDIQYLLRLVHDTDLPQLSALPGILHLEEVWNEQFTAAPTADTQWHDAAWAPGMCAACAADPGLFAERSRQRRETKWDEP